SDIVTVSFERISGGTAVKNGNTVSVSLDKKTGEVRRMYANGWWQGAKFESPSKAMSAEEIFKIYSEETTLKPWYRISWQGNKKVVNIVYEPTEQSPLYNAVTGEHSTMDEDRKTLSNTDLYEDELDDMDTGEALDSAGYTVAETAAVAAEPVYDLSEEEKVAVKELKGMLTAAKFKKLIIADPYINVTEDFLTDRFNISESELAECGYVINCTFIKDTEKEKRSYSVCADAKSGKVYSFYSSGVTSSDVISPAKASKLGTEAAKYYYGDIFGKYKADTENSSPAQKNGTYKEKYRNIRFYRYENNIQVDGDYINICVNSAGDVTAASFNHTTGVDFGDGKIISKETAMEKLFEQQQPELGYRGFTDPKSNPHTYLTYQMSGWRMNAKTGELCDYSGNRLTQKADVAEICPYTDIASSPYKSEIETLYNYGVRIFSGTKFDPKANITYAEANKMFDAMLGYGIAVYEPDTEEVAVDEEYDESGTSTGTVTNRQFAKRFVSRMNADDYAKMTGIYRSPFSDVSANDPDLGYICIAYGFGAACGENGRFNPDAPVTREYAMHCVYNFIKKQS
ncbi:MAG: S-layer homology domain-containing protein, partial [Ruminococcus sp.]|nr:S-layer homology domain-containing protein [Ruminococcus sp.]